MQRGQTMSKTKKNPQDKAEVKPLRTLGYIAQDQYGHIYPIGNNPPRKWLLDHFGRKHAEKMYRDANGKPRHVGYVIAGLWLEVFRVCDLTPFPTVN